MPKQLIVAVTQHRKFGVTLVPYVITPSSGDSFYSVIDKASPISIQEVDGFCDDYRELMKYTAAIDDIYIARLFSKEPPLVFFRHVDKQFVETHIRPYLEQRFKKMLSIIIAHKIRLFFKDFKYEQMYIENELTVAEGKSHILFLFDRNENGIRYRIAIDHGDHYDKLKGKTAMVITDKEPCNVVINKELYRFDDIDSKKFEPFLKNDFIHIRKETELVYFEKFILNVVKNYKVRATGFDVTINNEPPVPELNLEEDLQGRPVLVLKFAYGSNSVLPSSRERAFVDFLHEGDNVKFIKTLRRKDLERQYADRLAEIGFVSSDGIYYYAPANDVDAQDARFYNIISMLNQKADVISNSGFTIKQSFYEQKYYVGRIELNLKAQLSNDWFDLYGAVELNGFSIKFVRLRHNILHNIREYALPDGTIVILPDEWFSRFQALFYHSTCAGSEMRIGKNMFGLIRQSGIVSDEADRMCKMFDANNFAKIQKPQGLNATLRPYQLAGYYWMKQLKANNFGGCLADDMGLGKTLQTLALLLDAQSDMVTDATIEPPKTGQLSLFDAPQPSVTQHRPTSLIVMPLSLIHNWLHEVYKFAPQLRVLPHLGNSRAHNASVFNSYDIVITTYGLARNDVELLGSYQFYYIILDESQAIKNPTSKNYQSIMQLHSQYKLILTGTPVENSLTDLWAQMNFVNPGLLGSLQYFKSQYVAYIERNPHGNRAAQLQAMIEPFILRRTKNEVASDLPPKTEQIRICTMEREQQQLYEAKKSEMRNELLQHIGGQRDLQTSALVLKSLMRLRQIACHPKLAGFDEPSAKFDEVTRVLETIISEDHKVLVFSSFVKYLELYEQYLTERQIGFTMLTGDTQNREDVIRKFQTDNDIKVFLISLKAGGVGINLTSADYVFILDPWWNPAVENQAIDRAYRIGQERNVFVYKFITADTLEEKIINLQNHKSDLAGIVTNDNPLKNLSPERIMELFD
ncbi:MAG: hypothetical protein J6T12_00705 [Salinivirgaceae bacterium]|nr:hypothetical protein [Salinivirgaceae bacterium]